MKRYHLRLLGFYLLLLALGVFHPFVPEWTKVKVPAPNFFDIRIHHVDPVTNILLLVPFGALMVRLGFGRVVTVLLCALLSGSIELAQHWVAHRVAGIEDLILNTIGGGLGAFFVEPVSRLGALLEHRRVRQAATLAVTGFILWSAAPPIVGAELWLWHHDAVITAGDGPAGDVPWGGTVHSVQLYAGASPPSALRPEEALWRDTDGRDAKGVARKITEVGAFTIDLDVTMPPVDKPKPWGAMFVYAVDFSRMNIAMGHIRDKIIFRTKTRATPILGAFPNDDKPLQFMAMAPSARHRVTISFDGKEAIGYLDGEAHADNVLYLPPHNGQRRFWLPRGPWGAWLYAFCAAMMVAACAGGFWTARKAMLLGLAVALSTELIQVVIFSRGPDLGQLPAMALGAAIGAFSCVLAADRPRG